MFHEDDQVAELKQAASSRGRDWMINRAPGGGDFVGTSVLDLFRNGEMLKSNDDRVA